jgi:hypothetical protein
VLGQTEATEDELAHITSRHLENHGNNDQPEDRNRKLPSIDGRDEHISQHLRKPDSVWTAL